MVPICTILKIGRPIFSRKMKTGKNRKMKILRSAAPSQNFLKIPKPANFLDNFAPLILSKLFSTVVFWCLKVSLKNRTFPGFSGKKVPDFCFSGKKIPGNFPGGGFGSGPTHTASFGQIRRPQRNAHGLFSRANSLKS